MALKLPFVSTFMPPHFADARAALERCHFPGGPSCAEEPRVVVAARDGVFPRHFADCSTAEWVKRYNMHRVMEDRFAASAVRVVTSVHDIAEDKHRYVLVARQFMTGAMVLTGVEFCCRLPKHMHEAGVWLGSPDCFELPAGVEYRERVVAAGYIRRTADGVMIDGGSVDLRTTIDTVIVRNPACYSADDSCGLMVAAPLLSTLLQVPVQIVPPATIAERIQMLMR